MYPNPATEYVNIRFSEKQNLSKLNVQVYDLSGKQHPVSVTNNISHLHLDIAHLPKGMYFVRLICSGEQIFSTKLIKSDY